MLRPPRFLAAQLARPTGLFGRYVMSPFLNRMNAVHHSMVLEDLALLPTSQVLEIGFGGAALLERLCRAAPEGHVAGLEISEEMVEMARRRLRQWVDANLLALSVGSVESLAYPDETFDRACTVHTTYFWPDLGKGLAELQRVMRPGGRLVLGFLSAEDIVRAGLHRVEGGARCSPFQAGLSPLERRPAGDTVFPCHRTAVGRSERTISRTSCHSV